MCIIIHNICCCKCGPMALKQVCNIFPCKSCEIKFTLDLLHLTLPSTNHQCVYFDFKIKFRIVFSFLHPAAAAGVTGLLPDPLWRVLSITWPLMGVPGRLPDAYLALLSITRCLLSTSVYYLTPYGGPQSITRPLINSYYSRICTGKWYIGRKFIIPDLSWSPGTGAV